MPTYTHESHLDHPVDEVFAWHTRPGALQRLTPPWESVDVVSVTGEGLQVGTEVHLRLRKGPAALDWRARHTAFEENRLFRDEQVEGPFGRWVHEHRFHPEGEGCRVEDHLEWEPPLGSLGKAFATGFVEGELSRLFTFRHRRLARDLDRHAAFAGAPRLRVAVTGASGLVGSALCDFLRSGGHEVIPVVRSQPATGEVLWEPSEGRIEAEGLEGVDAVVHLAGEPIEGRWTDEKKERILRSREEGTGLLARTLAGLSSPPRVLVCASAVGFYGDRGQESLDESAGAGEGFLAEVCRRWEAAADPARRAGIRVAHLRTGMVLSPEGGALAKMLPPFKAGLGGRIGNGRQYLSWIDLDDLVAAYHAALFRADLAGPINATGPHPLPNATFTDTLARVLGRPSLIPVPALAIKTLFGEMGRELLLKSQRALPARLESAGFRFDSTSAEDALRFQLGRFE